VQTHQINVRVAGDQGLTRPHIGRIDHPLTLDRLTVGGTTELRRQIS
jgi:hypothetical protein